MNEGKI